MLRRIRRAVDAVFARARFEREMREELTLHLEHRADDLMARGLRREDALRQARVDFGAVESYKEQCRDARGFAAFRPFQGLWGDVRHGARRLRAAPHFLIFAVLSLAVGIGVTTAVYSVLYSLIWKPLAIAEPNRAVFVTTPNPYEAPLPRPVMSRPDFDDLRASQNSFIAVAASAAFRQTLVAPDASEIVPGEAVSGEYFRTLGVEAAIGRMIQSQDEEQAADVVVLNDRVWRARFNADMAIIGRAVRLGGHSFEVIGVAPRSFDGINQAPLRTSAWVPLSATPRFDHANTSSTIDTRERQDVSVVGRLRPARNVASAAAELATIGSRLDATYPVHTVRPADKARIAAPRRWSARSVVEASARLGSESGLGAIILGLVGLVLVVACTNLANLMLARGAMRQQELAVRRALGASRGRLVRELCVESALVAALGGVLAFVVIRVLLVLATVDLPLPSGAYSIEPRLSLSALSVASAALFLSIIVFGLEPALQLTRTSVTADIGGGTGTVGVPRSQRQRAFIRWQVAISATFFLVAAILAKVVATEVRHPSGVDVDKLAIATVHFSAPGWDENRARQALTAAVNVLRQERSIDRLAISSGVPFGMRITPYANVTTPDRPFVARRQYDGADFISATPEFFLTVGIPIMRGRGFDERDDAAAPKVMVASAKTVQTMFGTADPIGRQVVARLLGRPSSETYTIVGIARDTSLMSGANETLYVPLAQHYEPNLAIIARTSGDPAAIVRVLQAGLRRADPDLGTGTTGPASILMSGQFYVARIAASLAGALGLLTLILAMTGLYGVQSHIVARRTREVGVRMALGASAPHIERMVLREGVRPVAEGVLLGFVFAIVARLGLRATLYADIQLVDPIAFGLVPIPLLVAAFVACYIPARRAARMEPIVALRHL